ncbi:hypothetical protein ACLOJK_037542, partial [Asimina triloba]
MTGVFVAVIFIKLKTASSRVYLESVAGMGGQLAWMAGQLAYWSALFVLAGLLDCH